LVLFLLFDSLFVLPDDFLEVLPLKTLVLVLQSLTVVDLFKHLFQLLLNLERKLIFVQVAAQIPLLDLLIAGPLLAEGETVTGRERVRGRFAIGQAAN
jgi:hypothetical protein